MKADPTAQRRLLELQAEDTVLLQLAHRKKTLPVLAQIAEVQRSKGALRENFVAAQTRASDADAELARAESDLEPVKQRRERDQARVDAGQVPDAKALQQMLDEIAHLDKRISDLEDAELEAMERAEAYAAERDALKAQLDGFDDRLRALLEERDRLSGDIDADAARHQRIRDAVVTDIPGDLLALYTKVAAKSGGVGAAQLQSGVRCSGCGLEANPADRVRYRAAADDEVLRCEECDRILVRVPDPRLSA